MLVQLHLTLLAARHHIKTLLAGVGCFIRAVEMDSTSFNDIGTTYLMLLNWPLAQAGAYWRIKKPSELVAMILGKVYMYTIRSVCFNIFFREVEFGKESFVLSSSRSIGKLRSIEVQFKGTGMYLKKVFVYSKAEEKRLERNLSMSRTQCDKMAGKGSLKRDVNFPFDFFSSIFNYL